MRRRSPASDDLPDDPAVLAAMIERHLGAAQVAIRELAQDLRPPRAPQAVDRRPDLFDVFPLPGAIAITAGDDA